MISMNEIFALLLALVSGALLGTIFFGGLWWTVQKSFASKQPALWFFGSLLLRTGIVLAGFYVVGRGHWERLLVCLVGFIIIGRLIVILLTRSACPENSRKAKTPIDLTQEASHAS